MCIEQKDKKCVFTGMNFELEEHKKFLMITEMIKEKCLEGVYQEKLKISLLASALVTNLENRALLASDLVTKPAKIDL